jgi:hypothetical protein
MLPKTLILSLLLTNCFAVWTPIGSANGPPASQDMIFRVLELEGNDNVKTFV